MKKNASFLIIFLIMGLINCGVSQETNNDSRFSTPKNTVITLHEALKRNDFKTAQECYSKKIDNFEPQFWKYEITQVKKIGKKPKHIRPDFEIIVKEYVQGVPPLFIWFLLKYDHACGWRIADSVWLADENYPDPDLDEK